MSQATIDTRPLRAMPIMTGIDAMAAGVSWRRPQGVEQHVLVLTLSGRAWVGGGTIRLAQEPGDLLLVEPNRPISQDVPPDRPWRRAWALFEPRPHWYAWFNWPSPAPGYLQFRLPPARRDSPVRRSLESMHALAASPLRRGKDLAMNALEQALLRCDPFNPLSDVARLDPRVSRAMDFIVQRLDRPLTLDQIARAAGISVPHLGKLFRRHVELPPMRFLERQRMQRAGELLQMTGDTIASIGLQVGFDNPFYFSTRFRHFAGISPRKFRDGKK